MVQAFARPASSGRDNSILTVYHIRHKITTMTFFLQQTRSRVASSSLFAMLGLSIVLTHRTTSVLNFCPGGTDAIGDLCCLVGVALIGVLLAGDGKTSRPDRVCRGCANSSRTYTSVSCEHKLHKFTTGRQYNCCDVSDVVEKVFCNIKLDY